MKYLFKELTRFILKLLTIIFLTLAGLEYIYKGFVSFFFDVRPLALALIIFLILNLALEKYETKDNNSH